MDIDLIYLSLGSNIGDKLGNIEKAIAKISFLTGMPVRKSSLYETEPWENRDQEEFLNQIIAVKTELGPTDLLNELLKIEMALGRIRSKRNAPRTIDIDILIFRDLILNKPNLILPHPRIHLRKFILIPMNEIAPDLIHPVFNVRMNELLKTCADNSLVKKLRHHEIKSK
jgi:2-amino-4-hydroxy-6-hydroxymethyldihydropteridine diphosphokinase